VSFLTTEQKINGLFDRLVLGSYFVLLFSLVCTKRDVVCSGRTIEKNTDINIRAYDILYIHKTKRRDHGMISKDQVEQPALAYGYLNLDKSMRNLMAQLAYLTRMYFSATFSGFGNAEAVAKKLYSLPNRFQEKAELIFGSPLSEEFLNLLSLYVYYVQGLANALATGNQDAANYFTQLLYKNADALASQFTKMNPFWDEMQWKTLLYNYYNLIIQDAVALGSHDFEKELDIFERMLLAALAMGDYQADGFYEYMTAGKAPEHDGKC
jgi:hypothetical protein